MITREQKLTNQVGDALSQAGLDFDRQVSIGGVQADFLVRSRDDRTFVVDVKAWDKFRGFRNRAAHQASLYKEAIGADEAFLVVDSLQRSSVPEGVVTLDKLIPALQKAMEAEVPSKKKTKEVSKVRKPHIFAAMPFDAKYDDVFFFAMTHAAERNDTICLRVDQVEYSGDIVSEIHGLIKSCVALIADLSESRPNVLYETGYAHALGIPTIHICSTPLDDLPFDVAHWNTLSYRQGQIHRLREPLANRLKAAIAMG